METIGRGLFRILGFTGGSTLKAKSARGTLIFGIGTFGERGLRFVRNMILARLLVPEELALVAIVMSAAAVFEAFTQVGVAQSVVQHKNGAERGYLNAAWWLQVIRGLALYIIGFFVAPFISSFFNKPELINLLRIAFLALLFRGLGSPRMSVLRKQHKYGRVVLLTQGSGVVSTFVTIGVAFVIRSALALVVGFVAEFVILCILSYIFVPFIPSIRLDRASLSELMKFVRGLAGSPMLTVVAQQTDIVFLGKMVAESMLGLYYWALQLAYLPVILFNRVAKPVLLPAFSQKQDEQVPLRRALLQISRASAIIGIPFAMFMVNGAGGILQLVYKSEFAAVALPFAILSICAFFRIQTDALVDAYLALGKPYLHRRFAALRAFMVIIFMYPAILIFGVPGAAGVALLAHSITLCCQVALLKGLIGLQFLQYFRCWLPGCLAGCGVLATVIVLRLFHIQTAGIYVGVVGLSCVLAWTFGLLFSSSIDVTSPESQTHIEKLKYMSTP